MTSAAFPAVARVLDVSDTREYELAAGPSGRMRWRPIPGTGEPRPCDRCGRDHQVYVDVECADGSRRTVGTGCAEVAGLDTLASRVAVGEAEVAHEAWRVLEGSAAREARRAELQVEVDRTSSEVERLRAELAAWEAADAKARAELAALG